MKPIYIHNAASISALGYNIGLNISVPIIQPENFKAIQPDYKEVLPNVMVRRLTKISKMALASAMEISKEKLWDGIIVATGLGNLADTEKFINTYNKSDGGLIPPTSFTQSSHNTIAGYIALQLKNNCYNMSHVQREFSFENALEDAFLQLNTDKLNILLGAADEHIPFLDFWLKEMNMPDTIINELGEGSAFFELSKQPSNICIRNVCFKRNVENLQEGFRIICTENNIDIENTITLSNSVLTNHNFNADIKTDNIVGKYFTNSAMSLHIACSKLLASPYGTKATLLNIGKSNSISAILLSHEQV